MYEFALSPYSKVFYNEWKINPARSDYNIVFDQEIEGQINIANLNGAINRLVADYVVLNSHIKEEDSELYWIKNQEIKELEYYRNELTNQDILFLLQKPFDLETGPLYRFVLIRLRNNRYRFIVILHHIIVDGSSFDFFIDELSNYYNHSSYKSNISFQNQLDNLKKLSQILSKTIKANQQKSKLFWQEALLDMEPLDLSFLKLNANDKSTSPEKSQLSVQNLARINEIRFSFDQEITLKLSQLKDLYEITPYLYAQNIYAILLNRYTGQDKFCISYAVAIKEGINFIYGSHVNTNMMPYDFTKINNVLDIFKQSKDFIKSLKQNDIKHSYLTISEILSVSSKNIMDIAFTQTNLKDRQFNFKNSKIQKNNHTNIDLLRELFFEQEILNNKINFRIRYRFDKIDTDLINEFINCYQRLFIEILNELILVKDPFQHSLIKNYSILSDKQYQQIINNFNQTDKVFLSNKTISSLFEEQVAKTPDSIALTHNKDGNLTYAELNTRANQLAHYLQELGVDTNTLVLIATDRSFELIISMLGILKAGGAYVPLDLAAPIERLQFIVDDVQAPIIITDKNNRYKISTTYARVISLDEEWSTINQCSAINLVSVPSQHDLAYLIYTSGTTGNPKGVMVEHGGVVNTILSQFNYTDLENIIKGPIACGFFTNYAFDASVAIIFMPLIFGYKLVISDELSEMNISEISNFIYNNQLNFINCAQILNLLNNDAISVKCLITGGEKPDKAVVKNLINMGIKVIQEYGLTETSIVSTYKELKSDEDVSIIGSPIFNTKCFVLDKNLMPLPIGAIGELYIDGIGLARGYLNQPELTAERFIPSPFKNSKLYKTGDLVRWLPNGELEYIGRNDFQLKIRGYRIELGEIENILSSYDEVIRSVVVARENKNKDKYLVGYYVSGNKLDEDALLNHLRAKLPDYMVPTALVHMENLPLTVNGKLDRKALPDPELTDRDNYVSPRNSTEERIYQLWSELLGFEQDKVGVKDDFFRLGGNSIIAIKLVSKINKDLNVNLAVSSIFQHNTVERMASYLAQNTANNIVIAKTVTTRPEDQALSFAQERLWFIEKYEEGTSVYNIPMIFKLSHDVQLDILEASLKEIVFRHEVLRTVIREDVDGHAYQLVLDNLLEIARIKASDQAELDHELQQEVNYIFDLTIEYPIKVRLYELAGKHYLSIVIHHIAFDGWSVDLLLKEIYQYYNSLDLPELSIQYKDFALWQRKYLTGEKLAKQLSYWRDKLNGYETLNLITDKPRPIHMDYQGKEVYFELDESNSNGLRELAKELKVSLYSLLLAGYYLFLRAYSNQDDIVIGTPIANRQYNQVENLIGLFINSLALRTEINSDISVKEFIQKVGAEIIEAQEHQDLPFEKLVDELRVSKDTSRHPIFQVMFGVQDFGSSQDIATLLKPYAAENSLYNVAKFDISTLIDDSQSCLKGSFNYATSLYNEETIIAFIEIYKEILAQFVKLSEEKISDLSYLSDKQYEQIIYSWNATDKEYPRDKTIHELFEKQVEKTPNNIAVIYEDKKLTYQELNEKANQLAHYLRKTHDIKPDTLIALCLDRSEYMLIAILAVLKAGAAYVPMDPSYPDERIKYIVADTATRIILTNESYTERLSNQPSKLIAIDRQDFSQESKSNLNKITRSNDLAYVIYTSGTTGNPKGVMIEHKGVVNLKYDLTARYSLGENNKEESILQFSNYVFDTSVEQIILASLNGYILILIPNNLWLEKDQFYQYLNQHKVSHINATPTFLEQYDFTKITHLKRVVVGGELLNANFYHRITIPDNISIINAYGPTESTITSTINIIHANNLSIGLPISNVQCYVLDKNLTPLPIGAIGELYIGGVGLARGYLNQPELTAERFIKNPFQPKDKGSSLYKTGDLVRWRADGKLECIGRNDFQVKIRGYRIELGEVENALSEFAGIKQNVVLAKDHLDINGEATGTKYLIGYYTSENTLDEDRILSFLADRLPEYMVPSVVMRLEQFPLTINGKLDRKALPNPEFKDNKNYEAPRSEIEQEMLKIWREVLGITANKISINADFFKLGGDSIISIQLISRLRQRLGLNVTVKDIFTYKNIKNIYDKVLSKKLDSSLTNDFKIEQGILSGDAPLLPIQEWFFAQHFKNPNHWNQYFTIKTPSLDIGKLQKTIAKLVEHHDCFRMRYKQEKNGNNIQYYDDKAKLNPLNISDIRMLKTPEINLLDVLKDWQINFDLEHGPLYAIGYIHGYQDGSSRICFIVHHLLIDTVSWRILAEDLHDLYDGKTLIEKKTSYRQWAEVVKNYAITHDSEKIYWANVISDYNPNQLKNLVADNNIKNFTNISLDQFQTNRLLQESHKAFNTQITDILLTALGYALTEITNNKLNHIVLEGHGREEIDPRIDINRTLGWFTTMFPVKLEVQDDLGSSIKGIKETIRDISNKGIGYGAIYGYLDNKLPKISFNYLGQLDQQKQLKNWNIIAENSGLSTDHSNQDHNIVNINGMIINGCLIFQIESKLDINISKKLAKIFKAKLEEIINFTSTQTRNYLTLSDLQGELV